MYSIHDDRGRMSTLSIPCFHFLNGTVERRDVTFCTTPHPLSRCLSGSSRTSVRTPDFLKQGWRVETSQNPDKTLNSRFLLEKGRLGGAGGKGFVTASLWTQRTRHPMLRIFISPRANCIICKYGNPYEIKYKIVINKNKK